MRQSTIPGDQPNAAAFGIPGLSMVVWTEGAMKVWNDSEREAILAHEMTHIRECHMVVKMLALFGFMALQANVVTSTVEKDTVDGEAVQTMAKKMFAIAVGQMLTLIGISYVLERRADAGAFKRGHGKALASALGKLPKQSTASTIISGLVGVCHPSTKSRIARMSK